MDCARLLLANRGYYEAWRLQYLTDLGTLPDYEEGWYHGGEVAGRAGRRRRQSRFPQGAESVGRGADRRRALALVPGAGRRSRSRAAQRRSLDVRRLPAQPVRRADDGLLRLVLRPNGRRRHEEERKRHVRAAHARRRRNDRPAGQRHQAVQAARRVQLHQHLSADRRRAEDRLRRAGAAAAGADLREPPAVSEGGRVLAAEHPASSATEQREAAAARSDRRQLGPVRDGHDAAGRQGRHGRFPLPQRQASQLRGPRDQGRPSCSTT